MRLKVVVALLFALSMTLSYSCKIKEAPGAYEPAESRVLPKKVEIEGKKEKPAVVEKPKIEEPKVSPVKKDTVDIESKRVPLVSPEAIKKDNEVVAKVETKEEDKEIAEAPVVIPASIVEVKKDTVPAVIENTRKEKFVVVEPKEEELLKIYHVVIGSFGVQSNAERLKSTMSVNYTPVIVKNERGMYRVILNSFEDYLSARAEIEKVKDKFTDAWILVGE